IKPNIYGCIACTLLKVPYLTNITGLGSGMNEENNSRLVSILKDLYRLSLKQANIVFFQNEHNLNYFLNNNIKLKKYKLLPGSGVNTERFHYLPYSQSKNINIYYFGRLMKE